MGASMNRENGAGVQPDTLTVARRAWTERDAETREKTRARRKKEPTWPRAVLVLDTETMTDERQSLTFGVYRYYRWHQDERLVCIQEGIFYADDLPETDPAGYATLLGYVCSHGASATGEGTSTLRLHSRREFLREVFYPAAYKARALVVGFNLPFDLARLAVSWGEARGNYAGGFSLTVWEYQATDTGAWRENPYRPRVLVKSIDSKRALIGFGGTKASDGERRDGFRLRTLAFALTDRGHSLASACKAFGVSEGKAHPEQHGVITPDYIDYARQDVAATAALLQKVRAEFDRHPVELDPCKVLSPASLAKGYLQAMGVTRPLARWPDFSRPLLGQAMSAFYGGRAEARIRKVPVPVVYCDFLSMYPTVNTLLGTWQLLLAEQCAAVDATEDVRAMLAGVTPDAVLDPAFWSGLVGYAEVLPSGDVLPVRAAYAGDGGELGIGVNPYHDSEPRWYALPDVVAATLLTGRPPQVLKAWRLAPSGTLAGLHPVRLGGVVPVDPAAGDFFKSVIEERKRVKGRAELSAEERRRLDKFLKVLANSGAYGIFAQFTRKELTKDKPVPVRVVSGNDAFARTVSTTEDPGPYCFPPVAACVTAGARLMLALLERLVRDAGGSYAFCDTDSMAIVARESGGLVPCPGGPARLPGGRDAVRALSWAEVDGLVNRFAALNPYDRAAVPGSVLKVEDVNFVGHDPDAARRELWCYAISAKRYALYTVGDDGTPTLVESKEHGLGHLLNPTDPDSEDSEWMRALWSLLVSEALGQSVKEPAWLDRLSVMRFTASSPRLLSPLVGAGKPYHESVKPFNFLIAANVSRGAFGVPDGCDPNRFRLIRPYETDPREWRRGRWTNLHDGRRFRITTRDGDGMARGDTARVQSYRDVLTAYRYHPERRAPIQTGSRAASVQLACLGGARCGLGGHWSSARRRMN